GLLQSTLSISGVLGPIIAAILFVIWASYIPIILFAALMSGIAFIVFLVSNRGVQCSIPLEEERTQSTG
ncbi:MAG: hypothetical protein ACFFDQ_13790, partial [Candidatus Thorarchaeota archaeon]